MNMILSQIKNHIMTQWTLHSFLVFDNGVCYKDVSYKLKLCVPTVATSSVLKKPVLCTKWLNFTMLFYYLKVPAPSSPQSSTLALIGALK